MTLSLFVIGLNGGGGGGGGGGGDKAIESFIAVGLALIGDETLNLSSLRRSAIACHNTHF